MPERVLASSARAVASLRGLSRAAEDAAEQGISTKDVVALLGLHGIDYRQIRDFYRFIRSQAGTPVDPNDRRWARFSEVDIACLDALIPLCGGVEALQERRRLRVVPIRRACIWLRAVGFTNPLLQVPMKREGDRVYVLVDGVVVESVSGQAVLNLPDAVDVSYVSSAPIVDQALRSTMERVRREARRPARSGVGRRPRGQSAAIAVRITGPR